MRAPFGWGRVKVEVVDGAMLLVALGEYDTGWRDPDTSLKLAEEVVTRAAVEGARLVILPEMAPTGFAMDSAAVAEPIDGPSVRRLRRVASNENVWVVAGVATRESGKGGCAHNSALVIAPDGTIAATYHKQRLFAHAGEDASYTPGDKPVVVDIEGVRVSPFVCYDLRFPELFRPVARDVDMMIVIANWPVVRQMHLDTLARARAIENQCFVITVNRQGVADGVIYRGGSTAYSPWGDPMPRLAFTAPGAPHIVQIETSTVRKTREQYPFLRDLALESVAAGLSS